MKKYPVLSVVIDRRGSTFTVSTLQEAVQLQAINPGSYIMQQDCAMFPAFLLIGAKASN